jgi:hypothetical protein
MGDQHPRETGSATARGRAALTTGNGWTSSDGFSACKEQQLLFLLVRQLAYAQFERGDRDLSGRLWQEVAALGIDPERVTHLLYGGQDPSDTRALAVLDAGRGNLGCRPASSSWFSWRRPGAGGRRAARSAPSRVHQPAG